MTHTYLSTACLHAPEPGREALHLECQTGGRRWDAALRAAKAAVDAVWPLAEEAGRRQQWIELLGTPDPSRPVSIDDPDAVHARAVALARELVGDELIAEGRRQAAADIRATPDRLYDLDVDRTGLVGAEAAYAGVTDPVYLGYKAVWLIAEEEGQYSNVRFCWRYVEAALKAAREAAARIAEGVDGG